MINQRTATTMLFILTCFVWSTGFLGIKICVTWLDPIHIMTLRMLPACILFTLLWKKVRPQKWYKEDFKWIALLIFFDPLAIIFIQSNALPLTTASQAGMIFACGPLLMAIAARVFFKESIRKRASIGIVCAVGGVMLVAFTGEASQAAPNPVLGNTLAFFAVCCIIGYSLTVKRLAGHYKPQNLLAIQAIGASIVQIPLYLLSPPAPDTPLKAYLIMIYVGLFSVCFGYFIYNRALAIIKAAYVSLLHTLVPIFILILGYFILGERLLPIQYLGCALVVGGAVLAGIPEASTTKSVIRKE